MHTRFAVILPLLMVACAADPAGRALEIRADSGMPISGSKFECTGTPPHDPNPCHAPWSSVAATSATAGDAPGEVRLTLHRNPIPVDGPSSTVTVDLVIDAAGHVTTATARETTSSVRGQTEHSLPTSGYIEPIVVNPATNRFAGRFALVFAWGTIGGSYDTAEVLN